jgi:anti-sigma factor RsiW
MAGLSYDIREEMFSAYLDGELRPGELTVVSRMLTVDDESIAIFRSLQAVRRAVRLLPELEIPARLLPEGHYGDRLSAFLDGELAPAEMRTVARHLMSCTDCRSELQTLDRARIAIRALPGVEPPEILELRREVEEARRKMRTGRVAVWVGGVAAAVALLVGLSATGREQPTVDLADLGDRHVARASVTSGFQILPALSEAGTP